MHLCKQRSLSTLTHRQFLELSAKEGRDMMHMWYWFGSNLGPFLFDGYNVTSTWGLIGTCLGLASLALMYEAMKLVQIKLRKMTMSASSTAESASSENSTLISRVSTLTRSRSTTATYCGNYTMKIIEGLHWSLQTTLGYVLMLAVMSYNGYLSIALALGAGFGYWIFGQTLIQLNMEQLQQTKLKNIQCESECSDASVNEERRQSIVSVVAEHVATEANVEVHV